MTTGLPYRILFVFWVLLICLTQNVQGDTIPEMDQQNQLVRDYLKKDVKRSGLDQEYWKEATKGMQYQPEEEEPEEERGSGWSIPFDIPPLLLKVIFYVLVVLALGFVLFRILGLNLWSLKVDTTNESEYEVDKLEENLPHVDLKATLKKALEEKDFRKALRIYYLLIIQYLSERKLIRWEKDKTNWAYVREMRKHKRYELFREVTGLFEWIWYGEKELDQRKFKQLTPKFRQMLTALEREYNPEQ